MDVWRESLPQVFSGLLLMILAALVKYLRDISLDVRQLKITVPVLYERVSGLDGRVISLENHRRGK